MHFSTILSITIPLISLTSPVVGMGCYSEGTTFGELGDVNTVLDTIYNTCGELAGTYNNMAFDDNKLPNFRCANFGENSLDMSLFFATADPDITTQDIDQDTCTSYLKSLMDLCDVGGQYTSGLGWYTRVDPEYGACE